MSREEREKNIGEIVVRDDESFWIIPRFYVNKEFCDIYSPWFFCMGEKWQFILSLGAHYGNVSFYLWKKFRRSSLNYLYTVQIRLQDVDGRVIADYEDDFNCDYGFEVSEFCTVNMLRDPDLCFSARIKVFFSIKEKHYPGYDTYFGAEKNEEDSVNCEDEIISEKELTSADEITSDGENNEKENVLSKDKGIKILSENLKQVFLDGRMSDAVLKTDSREFNVHKVILIARSPVFASMFEHDLSEKKSGVVDIPDCTPESFEVFLYYLYSGRVENLSTSNVYNVYYAADKYRVDDLKEKCLKFMTDNISVETFCDVISLALRHGELTLKNTAVDFFCQNIKKIIKTVEWQRYMDENSTQANELFIKALNA